MNKSKRIFLGVIAIAFIVVSVICFVIPAEKGISFWIAYCAELVLFCLLAYIWSSVCKADQSSNGFLWFAPVKIIATCIILETILIILSLFVPSIPSWAVIIASIVLLGVAVIGMLTVAGGKKRVDQLDNKVQQQTQFISTLKTEIKILADSEKDPETKKLLSALQEKARFSDPRSMPELSSLEQQIMSGIKSIKESPDKSSAIKKVGELLNERNTRCKALK